MASSPSPVAVSEEGGGMKGENVCSVPGCGRYAAIQFKGGKVCYDCFGAHSEEELDDLLRAKAPPEEPGVPEG